MCILHSPLQRSYLKVINTVNANAAVFFFKV